MKFFFKINIYSLDILLWCTCVEANSLGLQHSCKGTGGIYRFPQTEDQILLGFGNDKQKDFVVRSVTFTKAGTH